MLGFALAVTACTRPATHATTAVPHAASAAPVAAPRATAARHALPRPLATAGAAHVTERPASATPAPHAAPAHAAVTPAPARTAGVLVRAPHAPPLILSASTSPGVVRSGDTVRFNVRASSNVASVEARVTGGYVFSLQKTGVGRFALAFAVPRGVPPFFHGTYSVNFIAHNSDGLSTTRVVPMTFQ